MNLFKKLSFQAKLDFKNGYTASVVIWPYTYGWPEWLYEVAILDDKGVLVYDTPITNDVIWYLTQEWVSEVLEKISNLPSIK